MAVSLAGLHPVDMRPRVEAVLRDPVARKHRLYVVSSSRTTAKQTQLHNRAVARCRADRRYCPASKWAARPGTSNHEERYLYQGRRYAKAVDFGVPGVVSRMGQWPAHVMEWYLPLLKRHGLWLRLPHEDWHAEPIEHWGGIPVMPRIRPQLKLGMKGEDVRMAQYCLKALGYDLDVDGFYGKETRAVVIAFQKKHKIRGAGIIGQKTWDAINWLLAERGMSGTV